MVERAAEASTIFLRDAHVLLKSAMRNTADAVWSQSIRIKCYESFSRLYDINGRKGEMLFFCSVPETTRNLLNVNLILI
jgi:hypothetical protein